MITKAAINAILSGAMLFALSMRPRLIAALVEGLRNFRDHLSGTSGLAQNTHADVQVRGDIWLLVCGAVLMISGLIALLAS
jgi:hypothetical protein